MAKMTISVLVASALTLSLHAAPAQAQLARSFVSAAIGNDGNAPSCDRLTPCRTFQRAHDSTLPNGEITVLDPGGYGAVTITKSLSIINDGVGEAGVLVSGGVTGIVVSASPTDAVSLRGLTIKGIGFGGGNGVTFNTGQSLTIENCVVRNMSGTGLGAGIQMRPPNSAAHFSVSSTLIADNSAQGIIVEPFGSGTAVATFKHVELYGNGGIGIGVSGPAKATIVDSVAANNGNTAFVAQSDAVLMVTRSVAANNAGGGLLSIFGHATIRIGQSTLTGNLVSWEADSTATIFSYRDKFIDGNPDRNPAPPTIAKQ